jgi:hypothetical protein
LRVEQTGEVFDFPVLVTLTYTDGRTAEVTVPVHDAVVEFPVALASPLKAAGVSGRDTALVVWR